MRIPLVRGRGVDDRDHDGTQRVVVINETMAQRFWPGADALGRRLKFGDDWLEIVGVVKDVKNRSLSEPPQPFFYLPLLRGARWRVAVSTTDGGLLMLGLLTGYGPLGHYLSGGVAHACPWAPVHGHVATLGWMGMTRFGLVYRAVPSWANGATPALRLAHAHFIVCVIAVLGVFANGIIGYRILDAIVDGLGARRVDRRRRGYRG